MRFSPLFFLLSFLSLTALAGPLDLQRRVNLDPSVDSTVIELAGPSSPGGAYPRTTILSDGSILGCYTAASDGVKTLTVTKSTNGGLNWSQIGTIAQSTGDLDNCYVLQLANGNVVAAFRNHDLNSAGVYTEYRITTSVSTDAGASWVFLSQVSQRAATVTNNGLWEPFLRISKADGSLQAYYSSENSAVDQDILLQSSTDNGQTWSTPSTVAGATTTGRDGMPGCVDLVNGTLMCVFETTQVTGNTDSGDLNIKSVSSDDEGSTWGDRNEVYVATAAEVEAAAPQIALSTGGAIVVSFYTDENNVPASNFKIITSSTGNVGSWGDETIVASGGQSSWPGLLSLPDGTVLGCSGSTQCHIISFS